MHSDVGPLEPLFDNCLRIALCAKTDMWGLRPAERGESVARTARCMYFHFIHGAICLELIHLLSSCQEAGRESPGINNLREN